MAIRYFPLDPARTAVLLAAADTAGLMLGVGELLREYARVAGSSPEVGPTAALEIRLGLPAQDAAFAARCREAGLWPDARLGAEGYALRVGPREILLAAEAPAGLYYGVQTLKQLLRAYRTAGGLPAVRVADWPALRYRGVMDDISRGPVPTLDFMKAQVRRLAEIKVNLLTYYTEHVVATEAHPAFAPADGAVGVAEWRALADYARHRHVTLVGNFQSFGHFEKILAHPAYAPLGESGRMLSPVLPESADLLRDVYAELVPAFDAPFFHVNSDETWDLGRGASKARVDSLGAGVVYAEHLRTLHGLLRPYDVRMMMWADIALAHPEALAMLPSDVVAMTWEYSPLDDYRAYLDPLRAAGLDFMVCPGVLNSNRLFPDLAQAAANIAGFAQAGLDAGALGLLNTVWDDGGNALFSQDWYGVAAGADHAWHPHQPDQAAFDRRLNGGVYGSAGGGLTEGLWALASLADLAPTDGLNDRVLWEQTLPERGQPLRLILDDWDEVLTRTDAATSALEEAHPLVYGEDVATLRFTAALYRHLAETRFALADAADAYRVAALRQHAAPVGARAALGAVLGHLSLARRSLLDVAAGYRDRWLYENRTYALDHVLERFAARGEALADAERRVLSALRDFDMGRPLPPPTEVRLAIEVASGTFFREWLVIGPFPNPAGSEGARTDYLAATGGERDARPGVTDEVPFDGTTYRWSRLASPLIDRVDLAAHYPDRSRRVALYAYATVESPRTQGVRTTIGSNDGIEVFLNGESVFRHDVLRNLTVDEDEVLLPLREGRNHVLLKISQGAGGWGFSLRLPDVTVRSRKNRYRVVE